MVAFAHTSVNEVFPTLIWIADLAPDSFTPLNDAIIARLDTITGERTQSYRSETFQTEHNLHKFAEFEPLVEAVGKTAAGALRQLAIDYDEIVLTAMWANINPPGAKHSIHSHPNNFFSGVYYVQCDAGAQVIRFHDPRPQAEVMMPPRHQQNVYNGNLIVLEAKPGRLVLFPAWLKHDVPTNLSNRERMSVSFDLMFPQFTETMSIPLWEGGAKKQIRAAPGSS
jgi:uncharacterized protein (TIGR02466 family)